MTGSGKSKSFYIIKSVIIDGKSTSKVVEKLGNFETVVKLAYPEDPYVWARNRAKELTKQEKQDSEQILVKYSSGKRIASDVTSEYNGGYLFLQKIYHELGLDTICQTISKKYRFKYDLNSILSRLIYSRVLYPCSKKSNL